MPDGFVQSLLPFFKKYKFELVFLSIAVVIAVISVIVFSSSYQEEDVLTVENENETSVNQKQSTIMVEIGGAVEKPGVYELPPNARLKDVIKLAGNLAEDADRNFFSRNFNLARLVEDQEKFYIPFAWEIFDGVVTENRHTLDYTEPLVRVLSASTDNASPNTERIKINSATVDELDTLPGIGVVTANKIIQNRPYRETLDLLNKKIVKKNIWENIKGFVDL